MKPLTAISHPSLTQAVGWAFAAFLLAAPYVVPLVAGDFWVNILTEILIWSVLAASVNLLLGYTGLLSFGQALYFGMGAYGVAFGFDLLGWPFWPTFLFGIALATFTAAIAGIFAVRLTWHYFAIITVVFSLIFYFLAVGWKELTNGDDGIPFSIPPVLEVGGLKVTLFDLTAQYYFMLVIVAGCYLLLWMVLRSPLGYAFVAVRDNESRARLIGLSPYRLRYYSFVLAGFLAGVSGVLFALFARYTTADYMFWTVSGESVVWTVVGGVGTLFGPALGTALLIVLREELSVYWEHFALVVGAIVIIVVTFAPRGIMGLIEPWLVRPSRPAPMKMAERLADGFRKD